MVSFNQSTINASDCLMYINRQDHKIFAVVDAHLYIQSCSSSVDGCNLEI